MWRHGVMVEGCGKDWENKMADRSATDAGARAWAAALGAIASPAHKKTITGCARTVRVGRAIARAVRWPPPRDLRFSSAVLGDHYDFMILDIGSSVLM